MFHEKQRVEAHPATDCWIRGDRYGTVATIGRKYVHVKMDRSGKVRKFTPDLLQPVEPVRVAPVVPQAVVGRKCWYLTVDRRKVAAVVDSVDNERHPNRLNIRITATKDLRYAKGRLINTPPAFVQPR